MSNMIPGVPSNPGNERVRTIVEDVVEDVDSDEERDEEGDDLNCILNVKDVVETFSNLRCNKCTLMNINRRTCLDVKVQHHGMCVDIDVACGNKRRQDSEKNRGDKYNGHGFVLKTPHLDEDIIYKHTANSPFGTLYQKSDIADRQMHYQFVLSMFYTGCGYSEANLIAATLVISIPSKTAWKKLENAIRVEVENEFETVIEDNLQEEINASETDADGNVKLEGSYDMGWLGATGRYLNSPSGVGTLIGTKTKKVIAMIILNRGCDKCRVGKKKKRPPSRHKCVMTHPGTSKSMEAVAAVNIVVMLSERGTPLVSIIGDDDSSVPANLRHSYKDLQETDPNFNWPLNPKRTAKKIDYGKLGLHIDAIVNFFADPTHRCKVACKKLFAKARQKSNPYGFQPLDAHRLKKNFGYWLKTNQTRPWEEFFSSRLAVIDHHFGDHSHCSGEFCRYCDDCPPSRKLEWNEEEKKHYRDKVKNADMYQFVKTVFEPYMTEEKLLECLHPYSSQKNEAFMRTIHRYAPKTRNFGGSTSLPTRVYLAAITDSIGTEEATKRVFTRLGITRNHQTTKLFNRVQRTKEDKAKRAKSYEAKRTRVEKKQTYKRKMLASEKLDKKTGMTYGKDAMDLKEDGTGTNTDPPKKKRKKTATCTACSMLGHAKNNTKKCPENPKYRGPAMKRVSKGVYTREGPTINNNGTGGICSNCEQRGHKKNSTRKCPEHLKYIGPPMHKLGRGQYIRLDICTLTTPAEDTDNKNTNTDETPLHESSRVDPVKGTADTPKQQTSEISNHRDIPSPITPSPPSENTDNKKASTNQTPLPESPRTEPTKRLATTSEQQSVGITNHRNVVPSLFTPSPKKKKITNKELKKREEKLL